MNKGIQKNPLFEKTSKQNTGNTAIHHKVNTVNVVKVTCYLSPESVKKLEKIWYEARTKHGARLTRSFIVDTAIELLEQDLNEKQKDSFLLMNNKK